MGMDGGFFLKISKHDFMFIREMRVGAKLHLVAKVAKLLFAKLLNCQIA